MNSTKDRDYSPSIVKEREKPKSANPVLVKDQKERSLREGLIYAEIDALSYGLTRSNGKDVSLISLTDRPSGNYIRSRQIPSEELSTPLLVCSPINFFGTHPSRTKIV